MSMSAEGACEQFARGVDIDFEELEARQDVVVVVGAHSLELAKVVQRQRESLALALAKKAEADKQVESMQSFSLSLAVRA